jgi:hypothetical protein
VLTSIAIVVSPPTIVHQDRRTKTPELNHGKNWQALVPSFQKGRGLRLEPRLEIGTTRIHLLLAKQSLCEWYLETEKSSLLLLELINQHTNRHTEQYCV